MSTRTCFLTMVCFQKITHPTFPFLVWFWIFVIDFYLSFWFDFFRVFLSGFYFWFGSGFWILNLVLDFASDTFINLGTLVTFNTLDTLSHFGRFGLFERKKKVSVTQEINLSPLPSESLVHRVLREVLPLLAVKSHWMIFYPEWVFIHLLFISSLNEFPRE